MQHLFARPMISLRVPYAPANVAGLGMLPGLADLGDVMSGTPAMNELMGYLQQLVGRASTVTAGAMRPAQGLVGYLATAANTIRKGNAGTLDAASQAGWNAFKAAASPATSDLNIQWVFGQCIDRWADQLVAAAQAQAASGMLTDHLASQCVFTLMDTTTQGTTWYGGTVTASKLNNSQWGGLFSTAFNVLAKGISGGVLSFTYLDVLCKAMLAAPTSRRFPVWGPTPSGVPVDDPRAAAFRAMMKQLGWTSIISQWFAYTQQAWASENSAWEAQDARLNGAITALNYVSGKALYDACAAKTQEYFSVRSETAQVIRDFEKLKAGPLGSKIPAEQLVAFEAVKKQFVEIDAKANTAMAPVGFWPASTIAGVAGLGAVQYIAAGAVLVALAGMIVWAIALMTSVSRAASAQYRQTSEAILATVDAVKQSCMRAYEASTKDAAAEQKLQECLATTDKLMATLPKPPPSSDPLGLKWLAVLGVVGIGGFIAFKKLK